jgi:hypothetical protein
VKKSAEEPTILSPRRKPLVGSRVRRCLSVALSLVAGGSSLAAQAGEALEGPVTQLPAVVPPAVVQEEQPLDPEEAVQKLSPAERVPTPSSRMTIRLNPKLPDQIKTYEALQVAQCRLPGYLKSADIYPWSNPSNYGQYIFICHDPLFFEDIPAERYGEVHSPCLQPVVSFTKFVGAIPLLPYKIPMNYFAASHDGAYVAYDHHYNLRPGVTEGSYFPNHVQNAPYVSARTASIATYAWVVTGVVLFLP